MCVEKLTRMPLIGVFPEPDRDGSDGPEIEFKAKKAEKEVHQKHGGLVLLPRRQHHNPRHFE